MEIDDTRYVVMMLSTSPTRPDDRDGWVRYAGA